jgi:hypothetical protein
MQPIGGAVVRLLICLFAASWLFGVAGAAKADESEEATRAQWRRVFEGVAADYTLSRASSQENLTLVEQATYTWARSGPHGGTYGSVYVWTDRGNAEAVACFWRYPNPTGRLAVVHELHSLSPVVLDSKGKEASSWKPKSGLKRHLLADAPTPAPTATGRMQQMRTICRDLAARSVSSGGDRTELRLLPQPLYRFQSTNPEIVDGALFAFVCSIGTDPEAFLQLEAIETADGPRWHFALARFSHMDLFVSYKDAEVWKALRDQDNPISHNAEHTYWVFHQPFDPATLPSTKASE